MHDLYANERFKRRMLWPMFEDFSRNSRFMQWLESVAKGDNQAYPERAALREDAASFLARWDRARREHRVLGERYRELVTGVATLAELPPQSSSAALLDSLSSKLESNTETEPNRASELQKQKQQEQQEQLDTARDELQQAQSELERTRKEITALQAERERERRRLESVTRYAYNLRRLMQKIHATGKLTPQIRGYIERLLEAGGVSVNGKGRPAAHANTPRSNTTPQSPVS